MKYKTLMYTLTKQPTNTNETRIALLPPHVQIIKTNKTTTLTKKHYQDSIEK